MTDLKDGRADSLFDIPFIIGVMNLQEENIYLYKKEGKAIDEEEDKKDPYCFSKDEISLMEG